MLSSDVRPPPDGRDVAGHSLSEPLGGDKDGRVGPAPARRGSNRCFRKWLLRTDVCKATALQDLRVDSSDQAAAAWALYSAYGLATFRMGGQGGSQAFTRRCFPEGHHVVA